MSGYKHATITISQEEFRRLNEAEMRLREENLKETERANQTRAITKAYQELEDRQAAYEKMLATMESEIAEAEADISREMIQQQNEYYQSLFDQIQVLSAENEANEQLLLDTSQLFYAAIREEKTRNKNCFDALREQLAVISETQAEQEEVARNWIKCSSLLSRFIDDQYDHQKFCPSQFDQAAQRLDLAADNIRRGFFEAGLQAAQEAYLKFSELRTRVEEATNKWQTAYQLILEQVQSIHGQVSATPTIPAIGLEGEDLHIEIDLDYWSDGKYAVLNEASEKLIGMLEDNAAEVTMEDLEMISARIIPKYKQEFNDIVLTARQNAINSQLKINVAYLAMKALKKHGFTLDDAGYDNDDQRDSFSATLFNTLDGSSIILEVAPDPNDNGSNSLSVETCNDNAHNERVYLRRWQAICGALSQVGVHIGQVQMSPKVSKLTETLPKSDVKIPNRHLPIPVQQYHYVRSHLAKTHPA